jgi:hypothetical protein
MNYQLWVLQGTKVLQWIAGDHQQISDLARLDRAYLV